jgi:glutathione gamma-glutamylcysteinyltransferase
MLKLSRRVFTTISQINSLPQNNPDVTKDIKPIMNPEMKIKSNLYKRKFPSNLIPFSSLKGQKLLQESLKLGNTVSFFPIMEQFQTQTHPSYCGPSTMVVNFNTLGIDPLIRWKG